MVSQRYRVVVAGQLSERLGAAFSDVALERRRGVTVLRGEGQAHLDSVLARLGDLGIEPLEVEHND